MTVLLDSAKVDGDICFVGRRSRELVSLFSRKYSKTCLGVGLLLLSQELKQFLAEALVCIMPQIVHRTLLSKNSIRVLLGDAEG